MSPGSLGVEQVSALQQARQILEAVGLSGLLETNPSVEKIPEAVQLRDTSDAHIGSASHFDTVGLRYAPPLAVPFTPQEILSGENRLTRKTYVHAIANHPIGSILEYPQTGSRAGEAIAHRIKFDPTKSMINPRDNIQYSLGDTQGYHPNVTCNLLRDLKTEEPVNCLQVKTSCKSRSSSLKV